GSPAPARARAPAGAAHAAPRARPRSDPRARRARSAPAAPTTAATHVTHPDPLRSRPTSCPSARTTRPPHDETQAGTACGTPASLAWPDSLSAGPDSPALSCPPNRGHSNDHSRLAYVELHDDERAQTVTAFVERALAFFAEYGITVKRLMTDNAFAYVKNRSLRELLAARGIRHLTTQAYRPRTNGTVQRFPQTLEHKWPKPLT